MLTNYINSLLRKTELSKIDIRNRSDGDHATKKIKLKSGIRRVKGVTL